VADDLDAWVLETAARATAYARSLLRNRDDADDLVQECYCKLLGHAKRYNLPQDGLKLLMTAITNACINRTTRRKVVFSLSAEQEQIDPADASAATPNQEAESNELNQAMQAALARLPTQHRAAIELKALGYTQQEIGEILGISQSNAGVFIHRGRQALAKQLTPFLGGEDAE
jgi:RNA polymerase sigma-70 factor, ECF subfamily